MAKTKKATAKAPAPLELWLRRIVISSIVIIPLFVSTGGKESFRLPKDVLFVAEGIVIFAIAAIAAIYGRMPLGTIDWRRPAIIITAATVLWTLVATLTSTNRNLSAKSLLWTIAATAIFLATLYVARRAGIEIVHPLLIVAAINAAVFLLQATGIWNPFPFKPEFAGRTATGFLGNTNDVGTALLAPAIAATALALASERRRKWYAAAALLLCLTIFATVSVAAVGALLVGLTLLALVYSWRKAAITLLVLALAGGGLVFFYQPLHDRVASMIRDVRSGQMDSLLSGRLLSFASAWQMFLDRPLTGMGPGTFGWHYFGYKLQLIDSGKLTDTTYATLFNFEETHNDHLEVLSETGAVGYLIFASALAFLASRSFRRRNEEELETERGRYARLFAFPFAAAFAVVALAQYPMQLAASTAICLFLMAMTVSWSEADETS